MATNDKTVEQQFQFEFEKHRELLELLEALAALALKREHRNHHLEELEEEEEEEAWERLHRLLGEHRNARARLLRALECAHEDLFTHTQLGNGPSEDALEDLRASLRYKKVLMSARKSGYAFSVVENDAPAKPTYLRLPVVDRKETTDSLQAEVERISDIAEDSLSRIQAKLKRRGNIAGHLKKKIVSQLGTLQKMLVSGLANIKDAIRSVFNSKSSSSYSGDGYAAIQEHFDELWGALSEIGMLELTTKAFTKGLIAREVKKTIFSENGTSEGRKADLLLSAIQERIRSDQSAFDTFVGILRSDPAYKHLADKLTS